jgi:predicted 3-demethylubiquinone-9 3-methyltransferase (glyoxalase superfamily)
MTDITPCMWFDTEAEDAANFYVSLFKDSRIVDVSYYGDAGPRPAGLALMVEFELEGQRYQALNGGPEYQLSEAFSLSISCVGQEEVDYFWNALSEGGEEGPCGWVKDRFGLYWQVVPTALNELLSDPDPERAQRAMAAMLQMTKIDVAALEKAADGG